MPNAPTSTSAAIAVPGMAASLPAPFDDSATPEGYRALDRLFNAALAPWTAGLSPAALAVAQFDWAVHLAMAPGKQLELGQKAGRKMARFATYLAASAGESDGPACIEPLPGDRRFTDPAWHRPPFSLWSQYFLLNQQWWHNATHDVPGVSPHHQDMLSFAARQWLDTLSPSNFPLTNPAVLDKAVETGGMNFVRGALNFAEDMSRRLLKRPPVGVEPFAPGKSLAVTPGHVVFRNHLIELIQYAPVTSAVRAEPILIVPAWIMKYYILDLSPGNSLIRTLVDQGFTVFCISWRNPGAEDRDLALDDYRRLGVLAALDAIGAICPDARIHATGYCLGGTLLAMTAAAMARAGDDRLASITLLAAQTDFTEPGELALFIDDSQLHFLKSVMWNSGYLSADQMAGAFQLLRSNDLIWSRIIHDYMMGERQPVIDLMAWNADTTRMPYRMHAEYLQRLYLDNELAAGRLMIDGHPAALQNIRAPLFVVGTEQDHVAPWKSVYKIHEFADTEVTFVLTSGGHNAGIVSEPNHPRRHFRMATKAPKAICLSAEEWADANGPQPGSWWQQWWAWLAARSTPSEVPPPAMGAAERGYPPLDAAPGLYVHQR